MNSTVFQRYAAYYDLLYSDKDYAAEARYVARKLRGADQNAQNVLEFGCGTGRHGRLLAEEGFHVFGVERSKAMVSAAWSATIAASPDGSFDCREGDIRTVEIGRVFDAVLSLFHVVSYQTSNTDALKTFTNAARHLRPQGIFLFDVWHGPAVLVERPSVRVKRLEDTHTRLTRIAEPELDLDTSVVTVRYTIFAESKTDGRFTSFEEEHHMRYFFPPEIEILASHTGFVVEESEEFLTGKNPSETTWNVVYLLRKAA